MIRLPRLFGVALTPLGWQCVLCALLLLGQSASLFAQSNGPAEYQVYTLKHKKVSEVEPILGPMLANLGSATKSHLVADPHTNQLLLRGSDEAQRIARQLIDAIDTPRALNPLPDAAPAPLPAEESVVRPYPCPTAQLPQIVQQLQTAYAAAPGVRVAVDTSGSRLFVLAPPSIHAEIAEQLATGNQVAAPAAVPGTIMPAESNRSNRPPTQQEQFVPLAHAPIEQIERQLGELLGPRLRVVEPRRPDWPSYWLESEPGHRVDVTLDRQRNGIVLVGSPSLVAQLARLIANLDNLGRPSDKAVHVIPIRRADRAKLREAIEAYREGHRPVPDAPRADEPGSDSQSAYRGGPARGTNPGGVNLVAYEMVTAMLQSDAAAPATTTDQPGGETSEDDQQQRLRDLGGDVQVEVLPDLDVIILQGRDRDVREMARIIAEIERLSVETRPVIEVVPLAHVPSQSMAAVINQVSADLVGGRQGRVSVTALVTPNALLLIGWGDAIKAMGELIAKLDQPVEAEARVQVFRLRHAPVTRVQAMLRQLFSEGPGLSPRIQLVADSRTNSLIVQASQRDMDEVARLVEKVDSDTSGAVSRAEIFKLKNSLAVDLATTLRAAIAAARGGSGAEGQKSMALEMLAVDAEGQRMLRSGVLADVEIVADARTNSLFVTAPAESMELVSTLIEQLDAPAATAQIKVFQVVNGDANDLVRMLRALLPTQQAGAATRPQLPVAEGETSLAPVRFSVDIRTNSIIATGSRGDLAIIEALLLRLDGKDVAQRKNLVYRLKNSPARDVARAVNDFLRSERQVQRAAPGSESPFQQIEREVVVVPEPVSNALIISATPRFFKDITDLVEKLDAQPPQVMIQVLIAEVVLDNTDEFGVELGLQDSLLFDRSLLSAIQTITTTTQTSDPDGITTTTEQQIVAAENTPGFNFNNLPLGNSGADRALATSGQVAGQSVSSFAVGRINNELGFGGLVLSASSESVSVLVRALQECRRLEVLSRPQIMTLDNQSAYIQVGQRVPRITGTTINATGQVNNIQLEDVGLILGVTPRISPDGMVVMELDAEKSELGSQLEGIPVSISDGQVIKSPVVNVTTAQTTVSAASGETIVLGGLITKGTRTINRRVPWLSDIPLVGCLFRYDSVTRKRTELLIIMTPWVVRTPEDAERIKQAEASRMHWCLGDVTELQGETGLYEICNDATYKHQPPEVIYPDVDGQSPLPPDIELTPIPEQVPAPPPMSSAPGSMRPPAPERIRSQSLPLSATSYTQDQADTTRPPVYQAEAIPAGLPPYISSP